MHYGVGDFFGAECVNGVGFFLFRVANTYEEPFSKICYPKLEYSQSDFLMNTIRILEDGRTQQY